MSLSTSRRMAFLLIMLVGLVSLVAMACGSSTTGTSVGSGEVKSTTPPKAQHFKVGDQVKVGDSYLVIVNSVKTSAGSGYDHPDAGKIYVVVDLSITNTSSEQQTISTLLQFTLKDGEGQKYNDTYVSGYNDPGGDLAPGDKVKGQMVYEVPKTLHSFTFNFEPDPFGQGIIVWDISI